VSSAPTPAGDRTVCPVCTSSPADHEFLFTKQGVQFWRCVDCGLEFVNPRPSEEWLTDHYNFYGTHLYRDQRRLESDFQAARFEVEWPLIADLRGALLDVGCSTGAFVKLALGSGFGAEGIDLSESAISYGRDRLGLPLRCGDFTAQALPANSYDVVTLWATLEHLPDPGAFVAEAHRVLRPSGVVAVTVPNHASATQRLLGRRNRYVGVDHLNYFTSRSLAKLVEGHGFRTEKVYTRKLNPYILYRDLRRSPTEGASVDEVISDQLVTDSVKNRALYAPLRTMHSFVERAIGRVGLGDLLLLRAAKSPTV
jgi:2-polyprenyl-3-methyl-5-hydroxy-6-metoxy-1,4-benzoquinol methylase